MACSCGTCGPCRMGAGRQKLAQRLAPVADRMRQRLSNYGLRPYLVSLVWVRWDGDIRGAGTPKVLREVPIRPTPLVQDLTSVALSAYSGGILPVGSIRISEITTQLTADNLSGLVIPGRAYFDACGFSHYGPLQESPAAAGQTVLESIGHGVPGPGESVPQPYEFFWEVREDRIGGQRQRYRLFSQPFLRAGKFDWQVTLARTSEDRERDGHVRVPED